MVLYGACSPDSAYSAYIPDSAHGAYSNLLERESGGALWYKSTMLQYSCSAF